jgi:MazG family protein
MDKLKQLIFDEKASPFDRLVATMKVLRSEEGCAWDRKQTHKSLLPYLIEEAYEVHEAVENEDYQHLKEELGDLVCQAIFHAQLADERNDFNINESITHIVEKLIRRHPHVFGEKKDLEPQEVRDQWEKIKVNSGEKESVLGGLPKSMPALTMAFRIGEKAGGVGFDWNNPKDVLEKIDEEIKELKEEIKNFDNDKINDEIGDLLFAIASLARKLEINPELSLKKALNKFSDRFHRLEDEVKKSGKLFDNYSLEDLEKIWQKVK